MYRICRSAPLSKNLQRRITSLSHIEQHIRSLFVNASPGKAPIRKRAATGTATATVAVAATSKFLPLNGNGKSLSTSSDSSESEHSPFREIQEAPGKPKKIPTPISKTPRGKAKARAKPKSESSVSSSSSNKRSNSQINAAGHEQHQHLTHFVKGGTPCDPAPAPFRLADYGDDSLYTLVLLRHGESEWNSLNKYTGWCDVNLTERGRLEARAAGRLLKENGVEVDHVFTSVLRRANFTTNMALNTAGQHWVPVTKTWRLNERHYGALQGYNKDTAYEELGIDQELVMEMRRSYDTPPPVMGDDHPYWHGNDRRSVKVVLQEQ